MAMFRELKPEDFGREAYARRQAQHWVHTVIWEGLPHPNVGSMNRLSNVIEAVERAGWRLDRTEQVALDSDGRPKLMLLFRAV